MSRPAIEIVAGTRPNFVKVAAVARALAARADAFSVRLVHTGQHYSSAMSDVFFDELALPEPVVNLGVGAGSHGEQTAGIVASYERHLMGSPRPAGVVVVGDSNSTMACALAASKLAVPVAHVEAGLRSFDATMPEEINRRVTDVLADLLLVSEPSGVANLRREGAREERVWLTGNVMIDTLVRELPLARAPDAALPDTPFAYVTLHRPSNVDDVGRLALLVDVLVTASSRIPLVFPVHPRTRRQLARAGLLSALERTRTIRLLEPLGYRAALALLSRCAVVMTDSGGIQEESSFLGVPCLTLRDNTERPVTVELGTNTLVGGTLDRVVPLVGEILGGSYKRGGPIPGWDGRAAERVADVLVAEWS